MKLGTLGASPSLFTTDNDGLCGESRWHGSGAAARVAGGLLFALSFCRTGEEDKSQQNLPDSKLYRVFFSCFRRTSLAIESSKR